MMEMVVALMAFSVVGTAVLLGVSTMHSSGARTETQSVAEFLARNQMEHVFSLPYQDPPSAYPTVASSPGYSVSALAEEYVLNDPLIEKVIVRIGHNGQDVLILETLRVK